MKYLEDLKITGQMDKNVTLVIEKQLKNREYWNKFCEVFSTKEDTLDEGWRAEYFGKMMRGATWTYRYSHDEELYEVLTEAAENLLALQEMNGRFSTYALEKEFCGWDMWGRKYVLTGLLHYRSICKDEDLKDKILISLEKHLDYIVTKIGGGDDKTPITSTSSWWGGVNSCSILETVVEMYKETGKKDYLRFAEYIISTGGCSEGNLIELALANDKMPFEYPTVKAYEVMSFFEGVLAYYEVTGIDKYYKAVCSFVEAVYKSDVTIIGCSGCTHELFDNSYIKQTEYSDVIMQETCVTVTWMRLLSRLYLISGNPTYIDRIEVSGFNALYGSINTEGNEQYSFERKKYVSAMLFDSYSPLYYNKRGRGIGGYKEFKSGGYYGCCVAIAACGIALMPLTSIMKDEKGPIINLLCNAVLKEKDYTLEIESSYPSCGQGKITVKCEKETNINLRIRRPSWCNKMSVNNTVVDEDGYYTISGPLNDGDTFAVNYDMVLKPIKLNGKIAFMYGPLVLAADALKTDKDIRKPLHIEKTDYKVLSAEKGEFIRIGLLTGDDEILLTDYQSCGKKWLNYNAFMTAWFNEK